MPPTPCSTTGKADAFASDDILLAGLIATHPDGSRFGIVGDYLSYEPYAIMLRRRSRVCGISSGTASERMAGEGTLTRLYKRWFLDACPPGKRSTFR